MKKNENVKNVYELAQERLAVLFKEFDNIYVSFSGGKDSGVLLNLCIDYIRRNNLKIKLGVFFMDYEVQYDHTIAFINRILENNKDILEVYRICVPFKVRTCTSMYQHYWRPWDEALRDIWVREMPEGVMKAEDFTFFMTTCGIMSFSYVLPPGCMKRKRLSVRLVWWVYVHRKVTIAGVPLWRFEAAALSQLSVEFEDCQ